MRTEKVKTIDETEIEVDIKYLSYQQTSQLKTKYLPIGLKNDDLIMEKPDIFGLQAETLKLAGVHIDKILPEEGDRLFQKYFSHILGGLSGEDSKN